MGADSERQRVIRAEVARLVSQLEKAWVDPQHGDLAAVTEMLEKRQEILAQIQDADTSCLTPETRAELHGRIQAVRRRDQTLLGALAGQQEELQKSLSGVVRARTAVRGYKAAEEEPGPGLRRLG